MCKLETTSLRSIFWSSWHFFSELGGREDRVGYCIVKEVKHCLLHSVWFAGRSFHGARRFAGKDAGRSARRFSRQGPQLGPHAGCTFRCCSRPQYRNWWHYQPRCAAGSASGESGHSQPRSFRAAACVHHSGACGIFALPTPSLQSSTCSLARDTSAVWLREGVKRLSDPTCTPFNLLHLAHLVHLLCCVAAVWQRVLLVSPR